jgi:hypothetical protein
MGNGTADSPLDVNVFELTHFANTQSTGSLLTAVDLPTTGELMFNLDVVMHTGSSLFRLVTITGRVDIASKAGSFVQTASNVSASFNVGFTGTALYLPYVSTNVRTVYIRAQFIHYVGNLQATYIPITSSVLTAAPTGLVQLTDITASGLSSIVHDATLTGNGTTTTPLGIDPALKDGWDAKLGTVAHDTSLSGDGTAGSPLAVVAKSSIEPDRIIQRDSNGFFNVLDPTAEAHPASKKYVDAADAALGQRITDVENLGHYLGSVATYADLATFTLPANATVNDFATVRADETHSGNITRYVLTVLSPKTWTFDFEITADASGKMDKISNPTAGRIATVKTDGNLEATLDPATLATAANLTAHTGNTTVHITGAERTTWNGKAAQTDLTAHTGNADIHVTSADKTTWSGKLATVAVDGTTITGDGTPGDPLKAAAAGRFLNLITPFDNLATVTLPPDVIVDDYVVSGKLFTETTLPSSREWSAIAYGGGMFVAIASNSMDCVDSPNGINWAGSTLPATAAWSAVAYGAGKFVAVATGTATAAGSTNGFSWSGISMPSSANWRSIVYGGGKFVAIASNSTACAYSTDGISWTNTQIGQSLEWCSIAYGNGQFVAIATNSAKCAHSADGITWYEGNMPHSIIWRSVAFGGGKFLAIAASGATAAYSLDGASWVNATLPISANWRAIAYGGGKFVAVIDGSDQVAYSADGADWSVATLSSSQNWSAITYGEDKGFMAVASNSVVGLYSSANLFRYKLTSLNPRTWEQGVAVEGDPFLSLSNMQLLEDIHISSEGHEHFLISYDDHPSAESTMYTLKLVNHNTDEFAYVLVYIKADGTIVSSFTMQQYGKFKPYIEYYRAANYKDALRITLTNDATYDIIAEAYSDGHKVDLIVNADDTLPDGTGYIVEDHSPEPPPVPVNPVSILRANDIEANDYIDIQMTFAQWEPIDIEIIGVNKFNAYGRWNGTDASLGVTAPTGVEVTPLGGGSIRIRNTTTAKWYGNLIKVTYRPSAVVITRNTPA